ncbi:hypothetical protein [Novacetimonas hansenii]|uniref:hypothetical protein n=2 Tax=Novacetimonas hansenii TaxID=436 RepID=UPI0011151308|nr:hypothetical protein [Novacetimonas hansenii]
MPAFANNVFDGNLPDVAFFRKGDVFMMSLAKARTRAPLKSSMFLANIFPKTLRRHHIFKKFLCLKSQARQHPEIIKVFGEAFSKNLQKTPHF